MRILIVVCCWVICSSATFGSDDYNVANISKELRSGANAVIRNDQVVFQVNSNGNAVLKRKYAITILNEKGRALAALYLHYSNKFEKISEIKGILYNGVGKEIKKLKKNEVRDFSDYDGSVYSDARIKFSQALVASDYPFTVEYEYSEERNGILFYHSWTPQYTANLAVEKASFAIHLDDPQNLRIKEMNLPQQTVASGKVGSPSLSWKVSNLKSVAPDETGPNWRDLVPQVLTAPKNFIYGGYSGEMSSWQSYGKWVLKLNNDLEELPAGSIQKVKALVADANSQEEKVRRVYQYLQESTRYVSVQLGIGRLQPFEPSFVVDNGYGDCKALSFYTKAMLDAVGVKSHYTLVNAGSSETDIQTDFPSTQFNHVIVCVPLAQDTVWLECTSQTNPFGYLGSFTSDRSVLLITDEGGKLVRTPKLNKEDNLKTSKTLVKLGLNGDALASRNTHYQGLFYEQASRITTEGEEDQKKRLYKVLDIPSFQIDAVDYQVNKQKIPEIDEKLDIYIRKHASTSGKRLFISPAVYGSFSTSPFLRSFSKIPPLQEGRKTSIIQKYDLVVSDTVQYQIPDGVFPEHLPEPMEVESAFGKYQVKVEADAEGIRYIRTMEVHKGSFAPELYPEYRKFVQEVVKAEKMKIVLKNTT